MAYHYFDMLKDAYHIIKSYDPNDVIIAFEGLDPYTCNKNDWIKQFAEQVWKLGAANYCDAISVHAFTTKDDQGDRVKNPLPHPLILGK